MGSLVPLINAKVRWNPDKYMSFLHCDWLHFLWHGANENLCYFVVLDFVGFLSSLQPIVSVFGL